MSLIDAILNARGYTSRQLRDDFLRPDYEAALGDPFLLPDMEQAVARLVRAQQDGEKVVIYGDYDIDGLTASTVLFESFRAFGIEASVFIPNRFVEGYGLSSSALETIAAQGVRLVVTVDCGSLSHTEIDIVARQGLDVIVTDHHSVADTMPPAVAVINPKRLAHDYPDDYDGYIVKKTTKRDVYPFIDLAGVGVAFKLVQALQTRLEGLPPGQEKWLLDLVALGTVCDVVQLRAENRALVYWGLRVLRQTRRVGLVMLLAVARVEPAVATARTLGFVLGPRLNAAGRLQTAQLALDLLLSTDSRDALRLAETLNSMNAERRHEQDRIFREATIQASQYAQDHVLVVSDATWSHGIIGIVAAKLLETYHKPTFVLQELSDGTAKGSARSFGDFSAVAGIRATQSLLIRGGGHTQAAGVTLETAKIADWRRAINQYYRELDLVDQLRYMKPAADVVLETFDGLDESLVDELTNLEPYGNGNPEPVFCIQHTVVTGRRTMGADAQHVRYTLQDATGHSFDVIAWGRSDVFVAEVGERVDVWCTIYRNEWRGQCRVEGRLLRMEMA